MVFNESIGNFHFVQQTNRLHGPDDIQVEVKRHHPKDNQGNGTMNGPWCYSPCMLIWVVNEGTLERQSFPSISFHVWSRNVFNSISRNSISSTVKPSDGCALRCFWEVSISIQGDFLRRSLKSSIRLLISHWHDCQTGVVLKRFECFRMKDGYHPYAIFTELFSIRCDNVGWQLFKFRFYLISFCHT